MVSAAAGSTKTTSASQTILIALLVIFVVANLGQHAVIDFYTPSFLPSKGDFLNAKRSDVPYRQVGEQTPHTSQEHIDDNHVVAGLTCGKHGGPSSQAAVNEMVYWKDIPQDAAFVAPLKAPEEQYLTFEPGTTIRIRFA
jgi:hypothetical protein